MLGAHATLPISITHVNNCVASGGECLLGCPGPSTFGTTARQSYVLWLANVPPPAMSLHSNGTRHLSH